MGKEVSSGFYYNLLAKGLLKEEDVQPNINGLEWYVDSFKELSSCRSFGMASGPIPFTAIVEYSRIYEVEDFEEFLYLMRVMDYKYLDMESKKASSSATKPNKNNKGSGISKR